MSAWAGAAGFRQALAGRATIPWGVMLVARESGRFAILIAQQQVVRIMAGAETKKPSFVVEDDPKIVAGALEGLAEHRAGKGKSFESVADLKAYLEKL